MNRIRWYGPSVVLLLAVLATLLLGPQIVRQIAYAQDAAQITLARNSLASNPALADLSDAYRKVAQAVEPSVVHIEVLGRNRSPLQEMFQPPQQRGRQNPRDPSFDEFDPLPMAGNGSGWVYDDKGHIITNYHVIANAEGLRVTFFDGGKYDARVVGSDELTDVAVLKVNVPNLHPAAIADETVQPGDIVFAFGSPLNFDFSVSQGIVSAKGRDLGILRGMGGLAGYENFIQTDAAINPGNSGGPLTNIYGRVVGMNSAIASRSGGWMGIGFAIPVDMATSVADQIIKNGSVHRGYLGIRMLSSGDLTPQMAKTFGFEGRGVLIDEVTPGGPADKAGLKSGDIVTHINGEAMETQRRLRSFVASFAPGTTVKVTVFREGQTLDLDITLDPLPNTFAAAGNDAAAERAVPGTPKETQALDMLRNFGLTEVETFTPEMAERADITFRPGVMITDVRRGSLAAPPNDAERSLVPGSIIFRVDRTDVATVEELLTELGQHDAHEGIRIRIATWIPSEQRWLERYWLIQVPRN